MGQKELCQEDYKMLPKEGTRAEGVGKMRNGVGPRPKNTKGFCTESWDY